MPKGIDYGRLMHKALRQLVADVLSQIARDGLPGQHHLLITFDTTHPGVDMAASLRDRYPGAMTIVMQDWFTDLAVMTDRFTVTLNFGNVPEPIVIPFEAIKTFVDPSVAFGLRFDAHEEGDGVGTVEDGSEPSPPTPIKPPAKGAVVSLEQFRNKN